MATKAHKKQLAHPPRTVYIEDDLWEWLQQHGEQLGADETGEPIKTAHIIRRILREYRDRVTSKKKRKAPPIVEASTSLSCGSFLCV